MDTELVAAELDVPPTSARSALAHLAEVGIVTEFTGYKRNRM